MDRIASGYSLSAELQDFCHGNRGGSSKARQNTMARTAIKIMDGMSFGVAGSLAETNNP